MTDWPRPPEKSDEKGMDRQVGQENESVIRGLPLGPARCSLSPYKLLLLAMSAGSCEKGSDFGSGCWVLGWLVRRVVTVWLWVLLESSCFTHFITNYRRQTSQ